MRKAIVIFSGGQDSTTCLLYAIEKYSKENVIAISYTYNSVYRKDIECAKNICNKLGVKHVIYDAGIIQNISEFTNIEGRNLFLVSFAAIYAQKNNIYDIILGITKSDTNAGNSIIHTDCSINFVKSLEDTLRKAMNYNINIIVPLINMDKKEIWKLADELGYLKFVEEETYSCWTSNKEHCMKCESCKARFDSLAEYKLEKENPQTKINKINWDDMEDVIDKLSDEIKKSYNPDIILSIVRGGMIPSVMLSHKLNIRDVKNIVIKETVDDSINAIKGTPQIEQGFNYDELNNKKVLIVDDIVGTGETLKNLKVILEKYNPLELKTAICYKNKVNWDKYNKKDSRYLIDFLGKEVEGWVIFPWEK